jgi:hypothetical protein
LSADRDGDAVVLLERIAANDQANPRSDPPSKKLPPAGDHAGSANQPSDPSGKQPSDELDPYATDKPPPDDDDPYAD